VLPVQARREVSQRFLDGVTLGRVEHALLVASAPDQACLGQTFKWFDVVGTGA
jgi:hypothetical protein